MRRVPRFVVPVVVVALTALSSLMGATTARAGGANPSYVDFSQCANGALPSTSTACPGGFLAGGTLSNANSHYSEDNVVPQRAVVTLSSGSALTGHSFTFSYEARKGVIHTYDSLATWNVTQQTADPCQGLATGTCPAGSPSSAPIPDDPAILTPWTSASGATSAHMITAGPGRLMTLYGGTITGVGVPSHTCAAPCIGDDWATVTVTYSIATAPANVMLLFGGHLAAGSGPRGWGVGLGAANVNGGPYHFKWTGADGGAIGNRDNQISGTTILVLPVINGTVPGPAPKLAIVGATMGDGATLSGGNNPSGTLAFRFYAPSDPACGGVPAYSETVTVTGNGVYGTKTGFAATSVGTWHWTVSYSGDALNASAGTACPDGAVTLTQATPSLSAVPAPAGGIVGVRLGDAATLAGGYVPTGEITYRLYGPGDPSCTGTAAYSETMTIVGNGTYATTTGFGSNAAGVWQWTVSYSGDAANAGKSMACSSGPVAVAQAVPTLVTSPAPTSGSVGIGLADTATLAGGFQSTGVITFRLYAPSDPTCTNTPAFLQSVAVTGNGSYGPTAPAALSNAAGTWQWAASYGGDANNAAVAVGCDKEQVTIAKRIPVLTEAASPATARYGSNIGGAATLSGTYAGTGSVTFRVFPPADTACAGPASFSVTAVVLGDGTYPIAPTFTSSSTGTWRWSASYSGDANNQPASAGCDVAASSSVGPAPLTVTALDTMTVYAAALPTLSVTYAGFVLGETRSVLGGTLAFGTTATPTSTVGDYTVTPAGLTSTNYAITFVPATLHLYTGLARCWVPGTGGLTLTPLPGALVQLLSGASVVATTTADPNAGYRFFPLGPGAVFSVRYFGTITTTAGPRNVSCGTFFVADASGNAAAPDAPQVTSLRNHTWPAAFLLRSGVPIQDYLFRESQSTWYKIAIGPGQRIVVSLRALPQDYSLVVYRDIGQIASALQVTTLGDLRSIATSIAPAELSPAELSPAELSPAELSPAQLSPAELSPAELSPAELSPAELSPAELSPAELSPAELSPAELSPAELSPAELSPDAYSLAQTQALFAISAHAGTSPELVVRNTWNNTGFFYVRVVGHNGAYDPARPFTLSARTQSLGCTAPALTRTAPTTPNAAAAAPRTIILTDTARLHRGNGTSLDAMGATSLLASLATLAARPEVGGVVLDLAGDGGLAAGYAQWDGNRSCPEAANLVAEAIHMVVDRFRGPALQYIVLVGGNDVIPYRLSRDVAGLGSETMYRPPVVDSSASAASLQLGYVQSQDYYGATRTVTRFGQELYLPEVAVGRLVESAEDISAAITAYLATTGGTTRPANALVTGYDFLADVAAQVALDLRGSGLTVDDGLIEATGLGPLNPSAWTADQLRAKLFATPYDVLSLNAHFSASRLLAADYSTRIGSEEIDALAASLVRNALVLSTGCHSGYNIVDADGVPVATQTRDFPQVFLSRGNTLVGSTGYAYGDSQFIKYTEALVAGIVRELRYGSGAVSIGMAVANAKRTYLASLSDVGGIDAKALAELTLYGLPMRSFDLPAGRLVRPSPPAVGSTTAIRAALTSVDILPTYALQRHDLVLPVASGGTDTVSYYDSNGDVATNPGQPVLPRTSVPLDLADQVARGAVLVSGSYQDVPGFRPLVDVANTEVRGQHPSYASAGFAPLRTFGLNSLVGQTLVVTPFQYASDLAGGGAAVSGTARIYPSGGSTIRVYYSTLTGAGALADAPAIYRTVLTQTATGTHVDVTVGALSIVDVADLFVTYTQPGSGRWSSLSVLGGGLVAGATSSTGSGFARHYSGDIATLTPLAVRAFVQAVGGNAMVSSDTNGGLYYRIETSTATAQNPKANTSITLGAPASATYRTPITVTALLTTDGQPLGGKIVSFSLGNAIVRATTAADGTAGAKLPVNVTPSGIPYEVSVTFAEDDAYLTSSASSDLQVVQSASALVLASGGAVAVDYSDSAVIATLTTGTFGLRLNEEPVTVDLGGGRLLGMLTDGFGRVTISTLDFGGLAPGAYTATIRYAGDFRLAPTSIVIALTVRPENATLAIPSTAQSTSPVSLFRVTQQADGALGDLTRATVTYALAAANGVTTQGTLGVLADGMPASTVSLPSGIYQLTETARGYFASPTTTGTLLVSCTNGGKVTGVGWVLASSGAKANMGLTIQQGPGDAVPSGNAVVQFPTPSATFKATSFDSLVVCGGQFGVRGQGTVNGTPGFSFAIYGSDASVGDMFGISVWSATGSESSPDYALSLQVTQGGNITVH